MLNTQNKILQLGSADSDFIQEKVSAREVTESMLITARFPVLKIRKLSTGPNMSG